MEEAIVPVAIVGMLFIGLPGMILHYLTKWKSQTGISSKAHRLHQPQPLALMCIEIPEGHGPGCPRRGPAPSRPEGDHLA